MGLFKIEPRTAIRIDKIYDDFRREPEFLIGKNSKTRSTLHDMKSNPTLFAEMVANEDKLPKAPDILINTTNLGFADEDMKIRVIARVVYTFSTDKSLTSVINQKREFRFPIRWLLIALISVFTIGSALAYQGFKENAAALVDLSTECVVFTENGKPKHTTVFGERFYYEKDGQPRVVQREVTPFEKDRIEKPFTYCKWRSDDNITPISLMW